MGDKEGSRRARGRMVDEQLRGRDITDDRVLDAMREIPRHLFIPADLISEAYLDGRLRLGRQELGINNVEVLHRDGSGGLPEHAPYLAIVVTAAAPRVPAPLKEQLAEGGRLVLAVGSPDGQGPGRWVRGGA